METYVPLALPPVPDALVANSFPPLPYVKTIVQNSRNELSAIPSVKISPLMARSGATNCVYVPSLSASKYSTVPTNASIELRTNDVGVNTCAVPDSTTSVVNVAPVGPVIPVEPVTPVAPVLPVGPVPPVDPVGPVGPVYPYGLVPT